MWERCGLGEEMEMEDSGERERASQLNPGMDIVAAYYETSV